MADEREYLRIPNWSDLQARSDKQLRWCKLWANLLSDEEWMNLTFHQKGCLTELWMLATEYGNRIPRELVARRTAIRSQDLNRLLSFGLIEEFAEVFKPRAFKDLAPKRSDQSPTQDQDPDPEGIKRPTTNSKNSDSAHVSNAVLGLSKKLGSGSSSAAAPPSSKRHRNGLDPDGWERLNNRVRELHAAGLEPDKIRQTLSQEFSAKQIDRSVGICRERRWI